MTPKENLKAFIKGQPYEWKPTNKDLLKFGPEEIYDYVGRGMVNQQDPFPKEKYGGPGMFGVTWRFEPQVNGSIDVGRVFDDPSEWREKVPFYPLDEIDWDGIVKRNSSYLNTDKAVSMTIFSGFFERMIAFTSFEDALLAFIDEDEQEDVLALFDKMSDYYIDLIRHFKKYFALDILTLHDDWGSQRALLFSKDTHKKMVRPFIEKVAAACHDMDIIYMQHSCGFIEDLLPDMIEMGIDTWVGQACNNKRKLVEMYPQFKFAVSVCPPKGVSDDELMAWLKDELEFYKSKEIWYFNLDARGLNDHQKKLASEYYNAHAAEKG